MADDERSNHENDSTSPDGRPGEEPRQDRAPEDSSHPSQEPVTRNGSTEPPDRPPDSYDGTGEREEAESRADRGRNSMRRSEREGDENDFDTPAGEKHEGETANSSRETRRLRERERDRISEQPRRARSTPDERSPDDRQTTDETDETDTPNRRRPASSVKTGRSTKTSQPTSDATGGTTRTATTEGTPQTATPEPDRDIISGLRYLGAIVGVFASLAVGYGLGLWVFTILADDLTLELGALVVDSQLSREVFGLMALYTPMFATGVLAVGAGVAVGYSYEGSLPGALVISGVGSFLGFVAVTGVAVLFSAIVFPPESGLDAVEPAALVGELGALGFGVAVTAVLAALVVVVTRSTEPG